METEFKRRAKELVARMTLEEKISQLSYNAPAIERLKVPAYNWWNECLHGVARSGTATVFPQAISMAASFDEALIKRVAEAISDEARAKYNAYKSFGDTQIYQGLTYWSPNINLFRDPRWGRGHETYGEDPLLTGRMATAFVRGLQEGQDPKYRKLDATLKHFAVHSGPEAKRHSFDAQVSQKDLDETYLWAFHYCIQNADPSAVMGAYNRINGQPACASETYLRDTLYGAWGFDGYVVSDCGAISDINEHHGITTSKAESAARAEQAGCQLLSDFGMAEALTEAVENGLLTEQTVTEAAERLFAARFRLGMFDEDCLYNAISYDVVDSEEHRALNRYAAQKSMVLLKNNGILPLRGNERIAVIGPNADDKNVLLANYYGTMSHYTTPLRGIQEAARGRVLYARGCEVQDQEELPWAEKPLREALIAARASDVVVLCLGLNAGMEGEQGDAFNGELAGDRATLSLPDCQQELLEKILEVGKPVILVNLSGGCVNLCRADVGCAAVLQCFYPGAEGGAALADILFGKVSPSARLPITFYRSEKDLPSFEDYSMKGRTYRYFEGTPLYPFGHGLTYGNVEECWTDRDTVDLKNKGAMATEYTILQFSDASRRRLLDFKCVYLATGETLTVSFAE